MPARVVISPSFAATWEHAVHPWLTEAARNAWRQEAPTVVLVPTRACGYYLRSRMLEHRLPALALHFWTVPSAREYLARRFNLERRAPTRENRHLLLGVAAEEQLRLAQEARQPAPGSALSVASEPSALAESMDLLGAAGWKYEEEGPEALQPLAEHFSALVTQCGLQTLPEVDAELRRAAADADPLLERLLIFGFDGLHWPHLTILRAIASTAAETTLCLRDPRLAATELDEVWIGSWEQYLGPAEVLPPATADNPQPYVYFSESLEKFALERGDEDAPLALLIGRHLGEEARAVAMQAVGYLAEPDCRRLGIVVPGVGALAREISAHLLRMGVPHYDSLAHLKPGDYSDPAWTAWVEMQRRPSLPNLILLIRSWPLGAPRRETSEKASEGDPEKAGAPPLPEEPNHDPLWPRVRGYDGLTYALSLAQIESELDKAFSLVLLDDIALLMDALESQGDKGIAVAAFLRPLVWLPKEAAFDDYLTATAAAFAHLQWSARLEPIAGQAIFLKENLAGPIPRELYMRWIAELTRPRERGRDDEAGHFYSRVHLLTFAEAEPQHWSHLILTSQTESIWPPSIVESGFLTEKEIERLNETVRDYNLRVLRQGEQGEGHQIVAEGKGLCLGPVQRRALADRQFHELVERVEVALALSCRLGEEGASGRVYSPNAFFTRMHQLARHEQLTDAATRALQENTARQIERCRWFETKPTAPPPSLPVEQTATARRARLLPGVPFGEYEFSLRPGLHSNANPAVTLTCREWDDALKQPAEMWMRKILGVDPVAEHDEEVWSKAMGQWIHEWLSAAIPAATHAFAPFPTRAALLQGIQTAALQQRSQMEKWMLARSAEPIPRWWIALWQQALHVADSLVENVVEAAGSGWGALTTEFDLRRAPWRARDGRTLDLRGRVDLLLRSSGAHDIAPRQHQDEARFADESWWILDYKTGANAPELSVKGLYKGTGVQLALYALRMQSEGARRVQLTVVSAHAVPKPQISLDVVAYMEPQWQGLIAMQDSGRFGWHGALFDEYARVSVLPLATLAVDEDILEQKWALTHPAWTGAPA